MLELEREGEITSREYWDTDLKEHLRGAARRGLEADLAGDESAARVRKVAREIVDGELD